MPVPSIGAMLTGCWCTAWVQHWVVLCVHYCYLFFHKLQWLTFAHAFGYLLNCSPPYFWVMTTLADKRAWTHTSMPLTHLFISHSKSLCKGFSTRPSVAGWLFLNSVYCATHTFFHCVLLQAYLFFCSKLLWVLLLLKLYFRWMGNYIHHLRKMLREKTPFLFTSRRGKRVYNSFLHQRTYWTQVDWVCVFCTHLFLLSSSLL